jgi:magnesium transporter
VGDEVRLHHKEQALRFVVLVYTCIEAKRIRREVEMIHIIHFPSEGEHPSTLSLEDVPAALKNLDDLTWILLTSPTEAELLKVLRDMFHFHPLAIEDCLHNGHHTPKIDDFGAYVFMIVHALAPSQSISISTHELDLFLGQNYLVTSHTQETMPSIDAVWEKLRKDERLHHNGSDFLCHAVLDSVVDGYLPVLEHIEDETEILEDRVLALPSPQTLQRLLVLKHNVLSIRRIILPMRDSVNRLSRDPFPMIDMQSRIYFRDVFDHLVRIADSIDLIRDMINSAQEMYVGSTSLRLNEVMKALTIVSTIFLPLSFVAGVYGMNFHFMPEIKWLYGYPFAWGIFIAIAVSMLIFFKRRGWF